MHTFFSHHVCIVFLDHVYFEMFSVLQVLFEFTELVFFSVICSNWLPVFNYTGICISKELVLSHQQINVVFYL